MPHEQVILATDRLRDDLSSIRAELRRRYPSAAAQVTNDPIRKHIASLAETWLIEVAGDSSVLAAVGSEILGDLNVHFQRLLTFTEHATTRSKYDREIKSVLQDFTMRVVLPLKRVRNTSAQPTVPPPAPLSPIATAVDTVFVGQSFAAADETINRCVAETLASIGVTAVTGERPRADTISSKVKQLIDGQQLFVGIFTRRDKIARKNEWTTSAWVIDEKAYALGKQKPLILLKETGVGSIGGLQGDYEYIEFSRDALHSLVIKLLQLFELSNRGLRK